MGLGLTPHAGKLSYSIKLKFTPPSLVGCGVKLPPLLRRLWHQVCTKVA